MLFARVLTVILLIALLILPETSLAKVEAPLPRFVSVRSTEANIRNGPGLLYQIKWVIVKKGTPVEVIAEFEQWRKVKDIEGDEGWVHKSMLSSNDRTAILTGIQQTIYDEASKDSNPVAYVEKGVIAELKKCDENWCKVEVRDKDGKYKGWVDRTRLWGIYPGEVID